MNILKVTEGTCHIVETDGKDWNLFTRYGKDSWVVRIGDSDEEVCDCTELEQAFQVWTKTHESVKEPGTITPVYIASMDSWEIRVAQVSQCARYLVDVMGLIGSSDDYGWECGGPMDKLSVVLALLHKFEALLKNVGPRVPVEEVGANVRNMVDARVRECGWPVMNAEPLGPTKELEEWIRRYGSERDALNVALAKLQAVRADRDSLKDMLRDIEGEV